MNRPALSFVTRVAVLLAATMVGVSRPVHSAEAPSDQLKRLSLEELGQIVVTSVSKEPEEVWHTPAAIFVLTHDDIIRSGATSVADVLRLAPGVDVARIDSSRNWVVGVRGFGDGFSKSLLVLVDGRSMYTPLFGGVHWSITDMLLDDIDRIEIIRGPGATVWGANAVNGVINIITRPAEQTQGTLATVTAGTVDRVIAGARYGGAIGSTGHYRIYGKAFDRGPEWHSDDRDFDRWHLGQGGFRADISRGDRDTFTFHGDAYAGQIGESVLVASYAPPAHALIDRPADVSGQNLVARWDRRLEQGGNVMVQTYWDRTDRRGTDYAETRNVFDVDFIHQFSPGNRHSLIWGAGARVGPATYTQTIEAADFQPHDRPYDLFSLFAQDAIALPGRLTLTAGAKVEHNTYTGFEVQPSASVLWTPTAHQSAWFAATRAVRTPSRLEADIDVEQFFGLAQGVPIYARILGNSNVDAEKLTSVEGGYRALLTPSVYLDVTAFNHRYRDVIALKSPAAPDINTRDGTTYARYTFPFDNLLDGPVRGVEIAPNVAVTPSVAVRGSYSFLSDAITARPGTATQVPLVQNLLSGTPRHQVIVQGVFSHRRVDVTPTYRFVSERRDTAIPGYHELDVPVSWVLNRSFTLQVVGQNLLHDHHAEWARDPGPTVEIRRAAYVRLTFTR